MEVFTRIQVNAGVSQGSILGHTLFLLYINDHPDAVICNIAIYADDTTLYCKCDEASDLWQQPEMNAKLEPDHLYLSLLNWIWALTFPMETETKAASKKIGALVDSMKFISPVVAFYF